MEKLNLEHILPYIPYDLKSIKTFEGLTWTSDVTLLNAMNFVDGATLDKILLRPLSDIGDVPGKYLSEESNLDIGDQITLSELSNRKMNFAHLEYHLAVHLFENHFDCFGLIEAGLAVNFNDLKK